MKIFKSILTPFSGLNRFNRYYGNVIQPGAGYPTADEAKRDLRNQELNKALIGWMR